MRIYEIEKTKKMKIPDVKVGDVILKGKFKNSKATVKGFGKTDKGQPTIKTNKGTQKVLTFDIQDK